MYTRGRANRLARFCFYHDSPHNELVIKPRGGREKGYPRLSMFLDIRTKETKALACVFWGDIRTDGTYIIV